MYISNETIVYKTSLGMRVIQNRNQDELPRPLRTLLILINDKANVGRYKKLLTSYSGISQFGGVKAMLKQLYKLRLVSFQNVREKTSAKVTGIRSNLLLSRLLGDKDSVGVVKPKYSSRLSLQIE